MVLTWNNREKQEDCKWWPHSPVTPSIVSDLHTGNARHLIFNLDKGFGGVFIPALGLKT